jgi:hypothetical protein
VSCCIEGQLPDQPIGLLRLPCSRLVHAASHIVKSELRHRYRHDGSVSPEVTDRQHLDWGAHISVFDVPYERLIRDLMVSIPIILEKQLVLQSQSQIFDMTEKCDEDKTYHSDSQHNVRVFVLIANFAGNTRLRIYPP